MRLAGPDVLLGDDDLEVLSDLAARQYELDIGALGTGHDRDRGACLGQPPDQGLGLVADRALLIDELQVTLASTREQISDELLVMLRRACRSNGSSSDRVPLKSKITARARGWLSTQSV